MRATDTVKSILDHALETPRALIVVLFARENKPKYNAILTLLKTAFSVLEIPVVIYEDGAGYVQIRIVSNDSKIMFRVNPHQDHIRGYEPSQMFIDELIDWDVKNVAFGLARRSPAYDKTTMLK